jgi:TRAP-type C4-dicarboxylate transport system permease small subunit
MSKLFKGLAAWIDSPKGSKFGLVLTKILVVDVVILDILIVTLIVANVAGVYQFNTTEQSLAATAFGLLAMVITFGALYLQNTARQDYQKALQRVSTKNKQ